MRETTKTTEIDLVSGVFPNLDGYKCANKLRIAQNCVPAIFNRRLLTTPPSANSLVSQLANMSLFLGFTDFALGIQALGLEGGTGTFRVWNAATGAVLSGSSAGPASNRNLAAAKAFWPSQNMGFASQRDLNGPIRQITSTTTTVDFTGTNIPTRAAALKVHLERLWMLEVFSPFITSKVSKLWFTDVISQIVRANNWLSVPDNGRCLFIASPSDVDLGAQAHLGVGCADSIWVLDGDPTQQTAVLRKLEDRKGIASQHLIQETDKGAICLATDGEIYLIPQGMTDMIPLGSPIKNAVRAYNSALGTTPTPSDFFHWESPFLYYFPASAGGACVFYVLDLDDPKAPKWWGPHTHEQSPNANVVNFGGIYRITPGQIYIAEYIDDSGIAGTQIPVRFFEQGFQFRTQKLQTGYIFDPEHDVMPSRVVLRTKSQLSPGSPVTVSCTNNKGKTVSVTKTPATTASAGADVYSDTIFPFERDRVRGEFFFLEITGAAGKPIEPISIILESRVVGRKFK